MECTSELTVASRESSDPVRIAELEAEVAMLRRSLQDVKASQGSADLVELDDSRVLQEVGIYRYHHPLESAVRYRDLLKALEAEIGALIKCGGAIIKSDLFTFNNSLAAGRKLSGDLARLMLRAYNAEAATVVTQLRMGNVVTAKRRLEAAREAIAKLGAMMEMHISDQYHALRVREIELTADWLMKKQEEKEDAREERARLREEARVIRELQDERVRLDKERSHLQIALDVLRAQGKDDPDLTRRLSEIDSAIEQNDFRAANIRAGYVYVISNEGAFGPGVVKIGLTRRLEPLDRISELSGASVPFRFDVHVIFFSEDAVSLEVELHRHFSSRALNLANPRKEFFFATPREVQEVLERQVGNLLEFVEDPEAVEFRQSVGAWPIDKKPR